MPQVAVAKERWKNLPTSGGERNAGPSPSLLRTTRASPPTANRCAACCPKHVGRVRVRVCV